MRIKVLQSPVVDQIDGIDLRRFVPGLKYDVGNGVGALMLAEGWAEPLPDDEPVTAIPFSDADPFVPRVIDRNTPPHLVPETHPAYTDDAARAESDRDRHGVREPKNS